MPEVSSDRAREIDMFLNSSLARLEDAGANSGQKRICPIVDEAPSWATAAAKSGCVRDTRTVERVRRVHREVALDRW